MSLLKEVRFGWVMPLLAAIDNIEQSYRISTGVVHRPHVLSCKIRVIILSRLLPPPPPPPPPPTSAPRLPNSLCVRPLAMSKHHRDNSAAG